MLRAYSFHNTLKGGNRMDTKIVIIVEGGVVQGVISNREIGVVIFDKDTDGTEDEYLTVIDEESGEKLIMNVLVDEEEVEKFFE